MRKSLVFLFSAVLILAGCGGSGESAKSETADEFLKVVAVYPADNATGVALNAVITATMSEEIDPASVNGANFTVVQKVIVSGGVSSTANVVRFTPAANLQALTTTVNTLSGLKSKSGKSMEKPFIWAFSTGSAPDTTPPTVVSVSPASAAVTGVSILVQVTLNEAIDPGTLNANTFKLVNTDTNLAVSGAIITSDKVASIQPSANLVFGAHYRASIQAKDLAGNLMAVPYVWDFSTVAGPVVTTVTLATANWVPYSAGGSAQATFDKAAGKISIKVAGSTETVSIRWEKVVDPIKDKPCRVSFTCASTVPRNVEIQLKENGGAYHSYATVSAPCSGIIDVTLIPDISGIAPARLNINFGDVVSDVTIGTIKLEY